MAHTYDTKAKIAAATTNPQAVNYTCGAGATLLVVTLIYANGTRTGAPTYNGVALLQADQVRKAASSPEACAELWYMLNPPTGSSLSISVPNPNALNLEVCISSYKAQANYSSYLELAGGNQNNSSANPGVALTTAIAGDVIVSVVASGHDTWAPSAQTGTALYNTDNGTWGGGHQYYLQAAAGAFTSQWTQAAEDWGACAAAFAEVPIGLTVSKTLGGAVLGTPSGISVSKTVLGAVVQPIPSGIAVAKTFLGAVIEPPPPTTPPPTTPIPTTVPPTTLAPTTPVPTTLPPTTPIPVTTLPPTTIPPTTPVPITTLPPTTIPPTTLAPTTPAPTVPPTTIPPTTLAPTTPIPTTPVPTTVAPTTAAPTTPIPTTLAPTTYLPTTLPSTTLAPTTLAPTTPSVTTFAPTTAPFSTIAPTTAPPITICHKHLHSYISNEIDLWSAIANAVLLASPITERWHTLYLESAVRSTVPLVSPIAKEIDIDGDLCW